MRSQFLPLLISGQLLLSIGFVAPATVEASASPCDLSKVCELGTEGAELFNYWISSNLISVGRFDVYETKVLPAMITLVEKANNISLQGCLEAGVAENLSSHCLQEILLFLALTKLTNIELIPSDALVAFLDSLVQDGKHQTLAAGGIAWAAAPSGPEGVEFLVKNALDAPRIIEGSEADAFLLQFRESCILRLSHSNAEDVEGKLRQLREAPEIVESGLQPTCDVAMGELNYRRRLHKEFPEHHFGYPH